MKGFFKSRLLKLVTLVLLAAALAVAVAGITHSPAAAAASTPSGERILGQDVIEPVFDDTTGNVTYVMTPIKAALVKSNPVAWAPFYVPVYPVGASVGTLQCIHLPADNCPSHGPAIAAGAAQIDPAIYGAGVLGHDHLLAPPASGGDFNISWEPILVLFTNAAAANTRLTTEAQIDAAVSSGNAFEVPLPQATFLCEVVSANVYALATPVTPV
jgi:hypothetical protein